MLTCERCGARYDFRDCHEAEECVEELQDQIIKFKDTFKVGYNRNNEYPSRTKMAWFEINGVLYQGGYDDQTGFWESENDELFLDKAFKIYWMYMLDLEDIYLGQ